MSVLNPNVNYRDYKYEGINQQYWKKRLKMGIILIFEI